MLFTAPPYDSVVHFCRWFYVVYRHGATSSRCSQWYDGGDYADVVTDETRVVTITTIIIIAATIICERPGPDEYV